MTFTFPFWIVLALTVAGLLFLFLGLFSAFGSQQNWEGKMVRSSASNNSIIVGCVSLFLIGAFGWGLALVKNTVRTEVEFISECEIIDAEVGRVMIQHFLDGDHKVIYITDAYDLKEIGDNPVYLYERIELSTYGNESLTEFFWSTDPNIATKEVREN